MTVTREDLSTLGAEFRGAHARWVDFGKSEVREGVAGRDLDSILNGRSGFPDIDLESMSFWKDRLAAEDAYKAALKEFAAAQP